MREPFPGPVPTKAIPQVCNSVTHTPQVPVTGCLLSREPIFLYHVITNITCIFKLQKQIGLSLFAFAQYTILKHCTGILTDNTIKLSKSQHAKHQSKLSEGDASPHRA